MSNKFFQIKGLISAMSGPWDNGNDANGGGSNGKPSNPWAADNVEPIRSKGKKPSLEELFRGGGNGFGGGLPTRPNGKPLWPLVMIALLGLWIFWTSVHRLEPAESGVVTTFGKYSHTIGSGVSFSAPYPIQNVEKVNTNEVRTITIGTPNSNSESEENLILTRDQNVINMAYDVRWQVGDPELFLFQLEKPDSTVREVAESAMRAAIANFDLIQAIGPGRGDIQADVRKRMQIILDGYNSGIFVQNIEIQQAAAPTEVREAFNAVNAAIQDKEAALNNARKYAKQVTERAIGDTAQFDRIYEQYALAPAVTRRRLYYETMETILASVDKTILESDNVTPFLPLPEIKRRVDKAAQQSDKPIEVNKQGN